MNNKLYNTYLNYIGFIPEFLNKYLTVPSLCRLKSIGYFCGMDYASKDVYDFKEKISRYDHSLTVALLTYKYTNDKTATIAALFHDVATPCFSHVIDYMNKDYTKQESTEEYTEDIIKTDENLKKCLIIDGINIDEIIDFKKFSIVDNDRPKLCTDRFDGIILTGTNWTKNIFKKDISDFINDLDVFINEDDELELGFNTLEIAKRVVDINNKIDQYCHSKEDNYMMELLALITKTSIDNGIITYEDLYKYEEKYILKKMLNSNNSDVINLLDKFYNISLKDIPNTEIKEVKVRSLNPLVKGKRYDNT